MHNLYFVLGGPWPIKLRGTTETLKFPFCRLVSLVEGSSSSSSSTVYSQIILSKILL